MGNRTALIVAALGICIVIFWTAFALTPSSYGGFLASIGAQDTGVLAGQPRLIRRDEWAVLTPYFQAAVRNRFERFNRTSFYGEDLRNINALPLRDWGMVFKPQLWAFFVLPAANAFGYYFGILLASFLAGYILLFQEFKLDTGYAIAASLLLFCCGFTQFWWTSSGPSLCFLPWVALSFLRPWAWFVRVPLMAYAMAIWVISCGYPILIITGGIGIAVLVAALRSDTLKPVSRLVQAAAGFALGMAIAYWYLADAIAAIASTAYPAQRRALPGTVPVALLVSQFWPAFTFTASGYRRLVGLNICEIGAAGSFFPALTICALDYSRLQRSAFDPAVRGMWRALALVGLCIAVSTWWMAGQCPRWIGRLLYWDHFPANRLLFLSGLLLLTASFILWQRGMVAVTPLRAAIFVALGPLAAAIVKMKAFGLAAAAMKVDWACVGLAAAAAVAVFLLKRALATRLMIGAVVGINALLFLPFNPLQSAVPIFDIPDNNVLELLTATQSQTPGGYIAVEGQHGATLNGLGLRSVSHVLIRPQPQLLRKYFPNMEPEAFNQVFNRYAWVYLKEIRLPHSPFDDEIDLPMEVFRPIRNQRHAAIESGDGHCPVARESVNTFGLSLHSAGAETTIEGWAPWIGESSQESLVVRTARPVIVRSLITVRRPDVAESLHNYQMEKAGFALVLSALDGQPLSLNDIRIAALGTTGGRIWIDGCTAQ